MSPFFRRKKNEPPSSQLLWNPPRFFPEALRMTHFMYSGAHSVHLDRALPQARTTQRAAEFLRHKHGWRWIWCEKDLSSQMLKNTLLFCDKILGFCTKTRTFPSSLQHSNNGHHSQQTRMQVWTFWWEIGQEPMVHSRFLPPKVASCSPLKRCQTVADFYHIGCFVIFLHPNPLPGITFRSTKQKNQWCLLPCCHHIECVDVHVYVYMYILYNMYISIYTNRIYMICSPSNKHHHNKTLHFSATAEIPDKSTRCPSQISVESVGSFVGRHPLHNRTSMLLSLTPCGSYSSFGATRKLLGDSKKKRLLSPFTTVRVHPSPMRRYWDAHLLIRNWKPNKKDKDETKRYQKIHQTKINKEMPMSKVPVSPEWFLFMAPTLVSWPPKGEIHQESKNIMKSFSSSMVLSVSFLQPMENLTNSTQVNPADLSGLHAAWSGMQRGCCGICISKSMRIRRSFNDGRFWSKQRTNLSTSGWHNQPVAGNLGATQKNLTDQKSNWS